jgi:hypothetical protein
MPTFHSYGHAGHSEPQSFRAFHQQPLHRRCRDVSLKDVAAHLCRMARRKIGWDAETLPDAREVSSIVDFDREPRGCNRGAALMPTR